MIRHLVWINLVLLVSLVLLWWLDASLEQQRVERRIAESTFHALAPESVTAEAVGRIELLVPWSHDVQTYVRRPDGWHLPDDHDAFALSQPIDGLLAALLQSRGTVAGRMPDDAEHFGLAQGRLEVALEDPAGRRLLRALAGRAAPGQRNDECYLAAEGEEPILHAGANPWNVVSSGSGRGDEPLFLDRQVIPVALGRGMPRTITFEGEAAPTPRVWVRKEVPPERARQGARQGPGFELYGLTPEGETLLRSDVAFPYLQRITSLRFDGIVGGRKGRESLFANPRLEVTLEYDGDVEDTLVLGAEDDRGEHLVSCTATGQVFSISADAAAGLVGTGLALLAPPTEATETSPAAPSRPAPDPRVEDRRRVPR